MQFIPIKSLMLAPLILAIKREAREDISNVPTPRDSAFGPQISGVVAETHRDIPHLSRADADVNLHVRTIRASLLLIRLASMHVVELGRCNTKGLP